MPDGDHVPRFVCAACGTIHYQNPKVVVGCLPEWEDRVLLCRRAIEPRHGLWTLPAGFLENGETIHAGAHARNAGGGQRARRHRRPLHGDQPAADQPGLHDVPRAARSISTSGPGRKASRCGCSDEDEIPWEELAFRTIARTLRNYFLDRKQGAFPTRVSTLVRKPPRPETVASR